MMLLMTPFAAACTSAVSDSGLCSGIDRALTEHAAALAVDAGPQSLRTGDRVIRMWDAACD